MFKKIILAMLTLAALMVTPAFADSSSCRNGKFVGSYTVQDIARDIFGDGSVVHTFVGQLNLHTDGSADQHTTSSPDYLINLGSSSPEIGSWTCRADGKLVVTLINGNYGPSPISANAPIPDTTLFNHSRVTYLFSIEDDNTLRRLQRRVRRYNVSQDPTDPASGTLRPLNSIEVIYKRLVASDADLLAP